MKQIILRITLLLCLCLSTEALAASRRDTSLYAVYLTWKENPDTTMVVQWVTGQGDTHDEVDYHQLGDTDWKRVVGRHKSMPEDLPYVVHRTELEGLAPDTVYEFRVGERTEVRKLRTMPSRLTEPVRFVVGGDMYHDSLEVLRETNRAAAATHPAFALVGGDIAYAAGAAPSFLPDFFLELFDRVKGQKGERWMEWLIAWSQDMVTPDGVLIPFLPVLGNHDVNGGYEESTDEAPFFYALFAFPGRRPGYEAMDFGHYMTILALDSGHTHSVRSQADWLEEALDKRQDYPWKFAFYHVPAYPSHRNPDNRRSEKVRRYWTPLFEEFSLTAAFEHHDHTYKRTYRLRDGQIDPHGVLYLGDGAWGIAEPRAPKLDQTHWYLAHAEAMRHFILVTISPDHVDFEAVSSATGKPFDHTTILKER